MKISELRAGMNKVSVQGVLESVGEKRVVNLRDGGTNTVTTALLADQSGNINLDIWGEHDYKVGEQVAVQNGYVKSFKGDISLAAGKFGTLGRI